MDQRLNRLKGEIPELREQKKFGIEVVDLSHNQSAPDFVKAVLTGKRFVAQELPPDLKPEKVIGNADIGLEPSESETYLVDKAQLLKAVESSPQAHSWIDENLPDGTAIAFFNDEITLID